MTRNYRRLQQPSAPSG